MPTNDQATESTASQQSLPKLSKADLLSRYRDRVRASKTWRKNERIDDTWKRLRDIYRLKMLAGPKDQDAIAVAIAFATINVIAPSVAVNHPKITVNARYEEEADQATIVEAVVNYWWQHYKIQPEFRLSVKDFLVYGHGWIKVGYRYEEGQSQVSPDEQSKMHSDLSAQADQFAAENPHLAGDLPTDQEISDNLPETQTVAIEDRPFVERVSPFDIYVDPEATCVEDMAWIAQRIVRPIEEVRRDPRFKASARKALESDGSVKFGGDPEPKATGNASNDNQVDLKRITLWEFYDIQRRTVSVFAGADPSSGAGKSDGFLIEPTDWDYPYGLPFVMLRNYDVPDFFYPIGEIEAIESLQEELNETRTDMVHARKGDVAKYMYRADAFDDAALDALRSNVPNTAVPIRDDTQFDQVIQLVPQPTANAQLYQQHSKTITDDIDRVTGVNEYQRGEVPETRRTATEASMIQDAANARAADKLALIEAFIGDIARCLVGLAQEFMSGEQVVRVVGQTGAKMWARFQPEDIQGEFDFEVEGGSTQPKNDTFKRQQAMQMAQALMPFVEQGVIDARALCEQILRDGYGIRNPEKFILPPPPPENEPQPSEKLIETIAYKDVPPDIQRQMEAQAGFKPSVIGGSSPVEAGAPSVGADPNAVPQGAPGAPTPPPQEEGATPPDQNKAPSEPGLNIGGGALGPGGERA